jgi:cytochrome c
MKRITLVRLIPLAWISIAAGAAHAGGDPAHGAELFQQNCAACHSAERGQNLVGPSLFSVVGRAAASISDFSYSDAMKRCGVVWTPDQLVAYLKAPRRFIPGVKMMFPGLPDQKDREDVVSFLSRSQEAGPANVTTAEVPTPNAALGVSK